MVALSTVKHSNALIPTTLPAHPTAVFIGGTKGIGAYSLLTFARYTAPLSPHIYVIARTPSPAITEAQSLLSANGGTGKVTFLACDAGLLSEVDRTCAELLEREERINVLFMTQGTLDMQTQTWEGLPLMVALIYHSRLRFAQRLLPAVRRAQGVKRIVNVHTGAKEGVIDETDWYLQKVKGVPNLSRLRGHGSGMLTLGMEMVTKDAPEVGVVHAFPGFVVTDVGKTMKGVAGWVMWGFGLLMKPFARFVAVSGEECGERGAFLATSSRFDGSEAVGVVVEGVEKARGTDGRVGSGCYTVDEYCENGNTDEAMAKMRKEGVQERLWKFTQEEWKRVLKS